MGGIAARFKGLSGVVAVLLTTASACLGCSNATRYLKGPMPVSALPAPTWSFSGPEDLADAFANSPFLTFSAIATGIEPGVPPGLGFRIHLRNVEPSSEWQAPNVWITVRTWVSVRPRPVPGKRVTVVVANGPTRELMLLDENGLLFHAYAGAMFPSVEDSGPLQFSTSHQTAYYTSYQARTLCNLTWAHSNVSVTTDLTSTTVAPGGKTRIRASQNGAVWLWHIASLDSSYLDETDCPGEFQPEVFFVIARESRTSNGGDDFMGIRKLTK